MKRTLLLGSAWTASAAAAVGLGFLAISLVGASASPGGQALAASSSPESSGGATTTAAAPTDPAAPVATGQHATEGGTVYGSCADGVPVLASAPAVGWWLDDSSAPGQVEFTNGASRIEVHVICVDGAAQFSVEGPRADDSGGHGSDDAGNPAPAGTTHSSGDDSRTRASGDDSSGRSGGGHGSDDGVTVVPAPPAATVAPTPDDSAGRVGGGHGSDDGAGSADSGDDSHGRDGGGHGSDD
jgi:hypothetical protein